MSMIINPEKNSPAPHSAHVCCVCSKSSTLSHLQFCQARRVPKMPNMRLSRILAQQQNINKSNAHQHPLNNPQMG